MHKDIHPIDKLTLCVRTGIKFIRGAYHRLFLGHSKGPLFVGRNAQITHSRHIYCGKFVKFEDYSEIHGLSQDGLKFDNYVTIGRGVMIRPSSYYGIDLGQGLVMGEHSSIGPYSYVGCAGKITIGNNVMFGPRCNIFAENHIFSSTNSTIKSQGVCQQGIHVEDDCWIGGNVTILDGVTIGKGSVIGAGTLVSRDIPPYSVVIDKRVKNITKRGTQK